MTQPVTYYDSTESIKMNGGVEYYEIAGVYYIGTFPLEWASNHVEGTGPINCENCYDYGCYNSIFIGYCANCAEYVYEGSRGRGFICNGIESNEMEHVESTYNTYLTGIDMDLVGINNVLGLPEVYEIDDADVYGNYIEDDYSVTYYFNTYGSNYNGGYDSY